MMKRRKGNKSKKGGVQGMIPSNLNNKGNSLMARMVDVGIQGYHVQTVAPYMQKQTQVLTKIHQDMGGAYLLLKAYQRILIEELGVPVDRIREAEICEEETALGLVKVDRPIKEGDTVRVEFSGKGPKDDDFGKMSEKIIRDLGQGKSGFLPELEKKLVGACVGAPVEFSHTYQQQVKTYVEDGVEVPEDAEVYSVVEPNEEGKRVKRKYFLGLEPFDYSYRFQINRVSENEQKPEEKVGEESKDEVQS